MVGPHHRQRVTARLVLALCVVLGTTFAATRASAQIMNPAMSAKVKKQKIYRGSMIIYENIFSAVSLFKNALPMHDPYYAQSITLMPQIWPRKDMFVRARLAIEVELTQSNVTDTRREPILSDLWLDWMWFTGWKIPKLGIGVTPAFRLILPTSKISQSRSMLFGIDPAAMFSRTFKLHKGKHFNYIALMYVFRPTKFFNEYATAQVDLPVCSNPNRPECLHSGTRNVSWRFANIFVARTSIMPKLLLTASVVLINDLLYGLPEQQYSNGLGSIMGDGSRAPTVDATIGASPVDHRAAIWSSLDFTYIAKRWLFLSAGISTFHSQLTPESNYRVPLINRFTNFYFDVTIPIAPFIEKVGEWFGGNGNGKTSTAKAPAPARPRG